MGTSNVGPVTGDAAVPVDEQHKRDQEDIRAEEEEEHFTPEQRLELIQESDQIKATATTLFTQKDFSNAIPRYEDALLPLPRQAHFHRAVLHSNIAACNLKLEEWKAVVKSATTAIEELDKAESLSSCNHKNDYDSEQNETQQEGEQEVEEEIISSGANKAAPHATTTTTLPQDLCRIRSKALLRRARANFNTGGWAALSAAESDYKELTNYKYDVLLTPADKRTVRSMLRDLPPRVKVAQEAEVGEMWGKLKELGNGILKPFGLSTDNFQMVKDEATGGYSMSFNQGGK